MRCTDKNTVFFLSQPSMCLSIDGPLISIGAYEKIFALYTKAMKVIRKLRIRLFNMAVIALALGKGVANAIADGYVIVMN